MAFGPDVWEVVKFLREIDERGTDAVAAAIDVLRLSEAQVEVAMRHYSASRAQIDGEIRQADEESAAAEAAWRAEQRLLG